jgi:hypothetical protein
MNKFLSNIGDFIASIPLRIKMFLSSKKFAINGAVALGIAAYVESYGFLQGSVVFLLGFFGAANLILSWWDMQPNDSSTKN